MSFTYYEDPILGKGRAQVDTGSGGSGGSSYVGGDRINIAGGTISFVNSADIVNVTGSSVTLQPDTAYKIYATSQAITLNANPPASGKWAYEGHIELFVAGTGYVVTGSNVVLANALEPDAVNNCTVRFHDGLAIISVEDHVAGYIVVSASGTSAGSLYYGLGTASEAYIAVDASLNGQVLDLGGVVTSAGEKHLVGNGYTETIVSGGINCTSKTTFANLAANGVVVSSGTLTLGDVYIPSGSTVAVSGGGLAIEKVTGAGSDSVIDLGYDAETQTGGTHIEISSGAIASASGCTFSGGYATSGGAVLAHGANVTLSSCRFVGNTGGSGGAVYALIGGYLTMTDCVVSSNTGENNAVQVRRQNATFSNCAIVDNDCTYDLYLASGTATARDCQIGNVYAGSYILNLGGSCTLTSFTGGGSVTLTSGAILDLTGNTNATPIAPGGGITFEQGGATVLYSSGAVSGSYMMDNVTLPAGAKLTNTAVVDLNGSSFNTSNTVSGCTLSNGRINISSGGIASDTGLISANMTVYSGGVADNVLNSSGFIVVSSGGVVNNATVETGARFNIYGTANEPIISSGGTLKVLSGGSALLVTSNTGALITVEEGGYITYKE